MSLILRKNSVKNQACFYCEFHLIQHVGFWVLGSQWLMFNPLASLHILTSRLSPTVSLHSLRLGSAIRPEELDAETAEDESVHAKRPPRRVQVVDVEVMTPESLAALRTRGTFRYALPGHTQCIRARRARQRRGAGGKLGAAAGGVQHRSHTCRPGSSKHRAHGIKR
jgi:hypothetical protein